MSSPAPANLAPSSKPDGGPYEAAATAFAQLCHTVARLRGPTGCSWDRQQTLASMQPHLLEEAYEVLEAMRAAQPAHHCEELGDLLLQIVMQAALCAETAQFDITQVVAGIQAKLVRRHPHIFARTAPHQTAPKTPEAVMRQWEQLKAQERGAGVSRLAGVPAALPGLLRAYRVNEKAALAGFDWPDAAACQAKVCEEWGEFQAAQQQGDAAAMRDEMGDVLLALVSLSRHLKIDPEAALRGAVDKFTARFQHLEAQLQAAGQRLEERSLAELNVAWEQAKQVIATPPLPTAAKPAAVLDL